MKRRYWIFLLTLLSLFLIGFSQPVHAASVKLSCTQKNVRIDETFRLTVKNTDQKIIWSSNNRKVARVTSSGKVTAKKVGNAVITARIGTKRYTCKVKVSNTVDVLVFAGQSNMSGVGDASFAPALTPGAGFAYNYVTNRDMLCPLAEPFGYGQDDNYFYNGDYAKGSMVTSFINAYYKQTKTPVVAIPAASVGTGSCSWAETRYTGVINRVNAAVKVAKKQGFTIGHVYLVWMQGENDAFAGMSAEQHSSNLKKMVKKIKGKTDIETCMVVGLPSYYNDAEIDDGYKRIRRAQKNLCANDSNFILISDMAASLSDWYLQEDGIHLTQEALNLIGKQAGTNAGKYAKAN